VATPTNTPTRTRSAVSRANEPARDAPPSPPSRPCPRRGAMVRRSRRSRPVFSSYPPKHTGLKQQVESHPGRPAVSHVPFESAPRGGRDHGARPPMSHRASSQEPNSSSTSMRPGVREARRRNCSPPKTFGSPARILQRKLRPVHRRAVGQGPAAQSSVPAESRQPR